MKIRLLTLVTAALLPAAAARAESIREDLAEFDAGKVTRFSTRGNPAIVNLGLSVAYPDTWQPIDPGDPSVLRQCIHRIGDVGYALAIVVTEEKRELSQAKQSDIRRFFELPNWADVAAPPPCIVHSRSAIRFEGFPAGRLEFSEPAEEGVGGRARSWGVIFVRHSRMVIVKAIVAVASDDQREVDARFEEARPLFQKMFDSTILDDVWQSTTPTGSPFNRVSPEARLFSHAIDRSVDDHPNRNEAGGTSALVSMVIAWTLGAVPALVIRFVVRRRRMSKTEASSWSGAITVSVVVVYLGVQVGFDLTRTYHSNVMFGSFCLCLFGLSQLILTGGQEPRQQRGPAPNFGPQLGQQSAGAAAPLAPAANAWHAPPPAAPFPTAPPMPMAPPMAPPIPTAMPLPAAPPSYGTPPAYGAAPAYAPQPTYGAPPPYGSQPNYGVPPGYGAPAPYAAPLVPPAPPHPAAGPLPLLPPPPAAPRNPPALPPKQTKPPGAT